MNDIGQAITEAAQRASREFARACEATVVRLGGPEAMGGPVALRKVHSPWGEEYVDSDGTVLAHVFGAFTKDAFKITTGDGPLPEGWSKHVPLACGW